MEKKHGIIWWVLIGWWWRPITLAAKGLVSLIGQASNNANPKEITGSYERKMFVYDARPLPKLKKFEFIEVIAQYEPVAMTSVYTGFECDGKGEMCCFYDGKPIGYVSPTKEMERILKKYSKVKLRAYRSGTYSGEGSDGKTFSIPEIAVRMPTNEQAKAY